MFRRIAVATAALAVGVAVSVVLVLYTSSTGAARSAGQLVQRGAVETAGADAAKSLVAVPIKELPPIKAGDRVDLFALMGSGDHFSAEPFAWAVSVAAVSPDGLVLQVPSRQEAAFVYAAASMRLAAVLTTAPAPPAGTLPITSPDQALAATAS